MRPLLSALLLLAACTAPRPTKHEALEAQDRKLLALLSSSSAEERLLARQLRTLHYIEAYATAGYAIAGVPAPKASGTPYAPKFPPTRWTPDVEADWIVVGSGPAGSVLAHELRRDGSRVLLIEKSSLIQPGSCNPQNHSGLVESRWTVDGSLLIRTASVVGGGTTVNVDLAFAPTLPAVRRRLTAWGWDVNAFARADEWVRATIGTRVLDETEVNRNNRILWDGAKALGLEPRLYDLNTYPPGQSPSEVTDKRCAVRALLYPAMLDAANPLVLLTQAHVSRVTFDGVRATGVELADGRRLKAKRVVLCAGALGSPLILLRSHVANEHIGRGVIAHPSIPLIGEFDRTIDALEGTPASVYVDRSERGYMFEAMSAGPDYVAVMWPGTAREVHEAVKNFRKMGGFGVMLVDSPHDDNRIAASGWISYRLSDADAAKLRAGIAEGVRILFRAGAKRVALPTVELPILTRIEDADRVERELRFIPSATMLTSAHLQSTCKMGRVVDREHRVIGYENLYVVDASVFPESCGANPMQTIYAMAKLFADRMHR